jgi:hypothetical protein
MYVHSTVRTEHRLEAYATLALRSWRDVCKTPAERSAPHRLESLCYTSYPESDGMLLKHLLRGRRINGYHAMDWSSIGFQPVSDGKW